MKAGRFDNPICWSNLSENETPSNSEFKPLTKQALEQRGNDEKASFSVGKYTLNFFCPVCRALPLAAARDYYGAGSFVSMLP